MNLKKLFSSEKTYSIDGLDPDEVALIGIGVQYYLAALHKRGTPITHETINVVGSALHIVKKCNVHLKTFLEDGIKTHLETNQAEFIEVNNLSDEMREKCIKALPELESKEFYV